MPKLGDILLIPVPYSDLTSQKRRPVIVISNDRYNLNAPDVVVVAMTSNPALNAYSFIVAPTDLSMGTLNRPGTVRVDKIYTLEKTLIAKTFGRVKTHVMDEIRRILADLTK